jgi:menaquinone-dependent protoporphyrinogen oxidase
MKILVATASRHGSTLEIAEAIGEVLRQAGLDVDVATIDQVTQVDRYDAAVIGSAVYMGDWLPQAREFVERNIAAFDSMPVWYFSSGPVGSSSKPAMDAKHLDQLTQLLGGQEARIFGGKLDSGEIGLGERLIIRLVKASDGDSRNWEEIRQWAEEIAATLTRQDVPIS